MVVIFFYCSLTDKPLIQQAAHMLPLKSSFPIALQTARLEGKRWEVLSTHLVETIPIKSNMGTQKSSHNEPMDLQPIQAPPTWRERRETLEALIIKIYNVLYIEAHIKYSAQIALQPC